MKIIDICNVSSGNTL